MTEPCGVSKLVNGGRLIGCGASRVSLRVPHCGCPGSAAVPTSMSPFAVDFTMVSSASSLARAIGCTESLIVSVINFNASSTPQTEDEDDAPPLLIGLGHHVTIKIPKKNHRRTGEHRVVVTVTDHAFGVALKALTRRLELFLHHAVPGFPSKACTGFVSGGSTFKNAQMHLGAPLLLTADIRDFFPSINSDRIVRALVSAGLQPTGAELIAALVTVRGSLPLGFSSSPMLSNFICLGLDARLAELARKTGATYSRYADDLAFSAKLQLPTRALRSGLNSTSY